MSISAVSIVEAGSSHVSNKEAVVIRGTSPSKRLSCLVTAALRPPLSRSLLPEKNWQAHLSIYKAFSELRVATFPSLWDIEARLCRFLVLRGVDVRQANNISVHVKFRSGRGQCP